MLLRVPYLRCLYNVDPTICDSGLGSIIIVDVP